MSQTAIRIQGVSKKYTIGKQKDGSLRGTLASLFSKSKSQQTEFMALKDVSFTVKQGEVVGIIGKNGAGKSTLLKVLSQITKPSSGRIELNGRVASLLEVGTGFHPELTGRENVFLNGTILGMTRKEVAAKFDEIVAFSGVEKFIDTPVKHYSSGMYVRLAFAVAAHLEPEILIIDEVLAVGDAEFQKKCLGKMKDVAGEGRTVLFVSHDLAAVKQLCTKGVLLNEGNVSFIGSIDDAVGRYNDKAVEDKLFYDFSDYAKRNRGNKFGIVDAIAINKLVFNPQDDLILTLNYSVIEDSAVGQNADISIFVLDSYRNCIYHFNSLAKGIQFKNDSKVNFKIPTINLQKGIYSLSINVASSMMEYDYIEDAISFEIMADPAASNSVSFSGRVYKDFDLSIEEVAR